MEKVTWVPVPGFEKSYEISSSGQVRTRARDIYNNEGRLITSIESRPVSVRNTNQTPYPHVVLHDGKRYKAVDLENLFNQVFGNGGY